MYTTRGVSISPLNHRGRMVHSRLQRLWRIHPAILVLLTLGTFTLSYGCPEKCRCSLARVTCTHLQGTVAIPPQYTNISISNSFMKRIDNSTFGRNIENFVISESKIQLIAGSAFSRLPRVRSISFMGSFITAIASSSFSLIPPHASILFEAVTIDDIASEAFANLYQLQSLSIKSSSIERIHTNAFTEISAQQIVLNDTEVAEIQAGAFNGIVEVDELILVKQYFETIHDTAFRGFYKIKSVFIQHCNFEVLHCNTISDLHKATVTAGGTFSLSQSYFLCDCSTAPLLQYIQEQSVPVGDSVFCILLGSRRLIKDITSPVDVCHNGDIPKCNDLSQHSSEPGTLVQSTVSSNLSTNNQSIEGASTTNFGQNQITVINSQPHSSKHSANNISHCLLVNYRNMLLLCSAVLLFTITV